MNDVVKENISMRLKAALVKEELTCVSAGHKLGIKNNYITMAKNPSSWRECPVYAWEILLKWVNSGQGIQEYFDKHGRVVPEKKESVPEVPVIVPEPVKTVSEPIPIVPKAVIPKTEKDSRKSNAVTVGTVNTPQPRLSNGQMVDFLLEEKAFCKQKIDAIDVLLKHYTPDLWKCRYLRKKILPMRCVASPL
jgi:hypothetical protein